MAGKAPANTELAQQIATFTTVVTNLANAIAGSQTPPAAATAPLAATESFATSPGMAVVEEFIDYTTKQGASLYEQVTKSLRTEPPSA